ncbi:17401_t:CDS:2, partial [Funneliformis caledonium]
ELLPVRMVESYFKEDEDYIFFDEIPNNMNIRIIIQLPTEFANNRIKFVDNITKFLMISCVLLMRNCYLNVLESLFSSPIYFSRLSAIVAVVMKYERGCSKMSLDRNQAIQSSTTTTENKRYRPDSAVYYNRVLVMMGEAKEINTKLEAAETQLDGPIEHFI